MSGRGSPVAAAAQQELDGHRLRELRARGPSRRWPQSNDASMAAVAASSRSAVGSSGAGLDPALGDQARDQPPARRLDLVALLAPGPVDALEHLAERRHAVARLVREVGAAVERPAVRGQEDRHRPAAAAGHRLDRRHVDLVEVGPLLAIDLDRDEVVVEIARRRLVLERLALHHVAPVTGRVADGQEDRPVQQLGRGERVGTPRIPVDGVVRMLEEVRAGLPGEAVGHGSDGTRTRPDGGETVRRGTVDGAVDGRMRRERYGAPESSAICLPPHTERASLS